MSDRITYVPGSGTALIGPLCVLLLPRDAAPVRVPQLWPLVRDGADLDAVLEALVAHGIRGLGPFVLLHGNRVVLRGSGSAEVDGSGRTLTGAIVTTWAEHALDLGARVGLRFDGEVDGEPLPVVAGVVQAAAVTVAVVAAAAVESEPQPEPEPEPEPGPEPGAELEVEAPVGAVPVSPDTIASEHSEAPARTASVLVDPVTDLGAGPGPVDPAADDGSAALRSELLERGAHRAGVVEPAGLGPDEVWGMLCPDGHANPPPASACRTCGVPLPGDDPVPVPQPAVGRLRVSDGSEVVVDRTVLIGRAPSAERFSGPVRLLRVISPQQDISRTHVEVRVEDGDVLVVDLSSNGTRLSRPGDETQMLPPGEPVLLLAGSVLDLGDGVSVAYEAGTA